MARPTPYNALRSGFTLVEMLVVLTIIMLATSIAVAIVPRIVTNEKASRGATLVQGMLLAAKQRAVRDRTAAGVRLIVTQDTLTAPPGSTRLICTELVYVIQPDDLVISGDSMQITSGSSGATAISSTEDFAGGLSSVVPLPAEQLPVQAGDFLELNGGGLVTSITAQPSTSGTNGSNYDTLTLSNNPIASFGVPVTAYRIFRGPRRVEGEDSLKLPGSVAILIADVNKSTNVHTCYSKNIPARSIPFGGGAQATFLYEIVFSPAGTVVGQGTNSGDKIVLYVRDMTLDHIWDGDPGLVVVNPRTGAIAVQPVDPTNPPNYYTFTTDPRSSGM
jgi:prepilin-type N-terminal cleavage/methylation domain-containing protein